jgi:sporulation integral membrane protein YlbJ
MKKIKYAVISINKNLISILVIIFIASLVLYSSNNIQAAKEGLVLWANSVVPSLFPFFVATEILCQTNVISTLGKFLNKPVQYIFNVPGEGVIAIIMGMISGYPTGAKIVSNFKRDNICTKEEAERLIAFTNNSGPLFILGTVGISILGSSRLGYILLISHVIAGICVGVIFRNWKKNSVKISRKIRLEEKKNNSLKDLGRILGEAITGATKTTLTIGGFVVIFSVIISILNSSGMIVFLEYISEKLNIPGEILTSMFSGIIELTNGVKALGALGNSKIILCLMSFLIGFGGISVLLQVYSIIAKENISIKPYIIGKILQATISSLITAFFLNI